MARSPHDREKVLDAAYSIRHIWHMQTMTPVRLRVRELRTAKGWTQEQLADKSGVNQGTISKIETGKTGGIEFDNLERLANALGVNAAFLVDHSTDLPPEPPATKKRRRRK